MVFLATCNTILKLETSIYQDKPTYTDGEYYDSKEGNPSSPIQAV